MYKIISEEELKFLEKYFSVINILFNLKEKVKKNPSIKINNPKKISILQDIILLTDNKLINKVMIYKDKKELQILTLEDDINIIIYLEEIKTSLESETEYAVVCLANSFTVDFDDKDC